jgi:hypothetical protein
MAELKVEKPSAPPKRTREELTALYAKSRGPEEMNVKDIAKNKELFSGISYAPASDDTPKSFVDAVEEAAIVGGGAAGAFRAQQLANAKAVNIARASGTTTPTSPQTLAPPDTRAPLRMPTTGNAGGGGGTASGGLITQGAQPNTSVIESGRTPFADPSTLRNVTPRSGAGIGSVLSGGAVLNPVVAGLAATAAMTGQAGKGSEVVLEGSTADMIRNPAKYAVRAESIKGPPVSPQELASLPAEFNSKEPTTAPVTPPVSRSAPEQRSPMEQQMSAPKAIPVAEPVAAPAVDTDRAAALFAKTHGSAFDPKSSMDKKKMAAITNLMGQEGSEALTPNQFALKIYRTTKK